MSEEAVRTEGAVATDLVRRIAEGDAAAESEMVVRYSRGLLYLLRRRCGDLALADDLHQETFRIVLERLRTKGLAEPEKLAGFLRATARNLRIADYRKAARRQTEGDPEAIAAVADPGGGPLQGVLRDEEVGHVRRLLGEMRNERDRELLYRFYLAEEEKERICADLGLSSLHFNRVLHRARQRFKALLDGRKPT